MVISIKKIAKMLKQLYLYLRTRGTTAKDEIRLIIAMFLYAFKLGKGSSIGFHIPGSRILTIRTWDGYVFHVRPKTTDLSLATLTSEFIELTQWFLPNAKGVVVDIGANIGGYTIRAYKQAEHVIAIEPQREVFELLRTNVKNNCDRSNVLMVRKAVGDKKGKALLKIPRDARTIDSGSASLINPANEREYEYEEVEMDTLDNIMKSLDIDNVDFVKIDIEGAEALAFKGMRHTLSKAKYIMIEIQPGNE